MATYKVRNNRTTAVVRYKGVDITQTFGSKTTARAWAKKVEAAIEERRWPVEELLPKRDREKYFPAAEAPDESKPHRGWTLHKALEHYFQTVGQHKKSYTQQKNTKAWWQGQALAQKTLADITAEDLQAHVTDRMAAKLANNTIRNEVFHLSSIFTLAALRATKGGWGLVDLENPVKHIELPPPPPSRKRRLEEMADGASEETRMFDELGKGPDAAAMKAFAMLALDTAMRKSEILDIRVGQVKATKDGTYIERPDSKNGQARKVVLSVRAIKVVNELIQALDKPSPAAKLFKLDSDKVNYRWRRARKKAGIVGLRLHDLRHEGISRMAAANMTIGELASQSGHKDVQVLLGYVNAKVSDIAKKLG